jgi:hypothetical protein
MNKNKMADDPFIKNTLQKVFVLEHELAMEKMKSKQLSESMRTMIDLAKLPKEEFKWYNLLGGRTMKRRSKRGGQPVSSWSFTPTSLPGAIGEPPIRPAALRRTDRSDDYVRFSPMPARRLDFSGEPGCSSVSKRLPGHRHDQCERTDNVDGVDRLMCIQPGEGHVRTADECGPTRIGGKRRKTRKNKKSKRKTRRKV